MSSWRISWASCSCCLSVSFLTWAGWSTMSRYRLEGLFIIQEGVGGSFEFRVAGRVLFQLADLEFSFFEFALAGFDQPCAFLEFGQQRFQREISAFHRVDDRF